MLEVKYLSGSYILKILNSEGWGARTGGTLYENAHFSYIFNISFGCFFCLGFKSLRNCAHRVLVSQGLSVLRNRSKGEIKLSLT